MSPNGVQLLSAWEASRPQAYQDIAGVWTIGCGHVMTPYEIASGVIVIDGRACNWHDGLTQPQVCALLAAQLIEYQGPVDMMVADDVNQNQFDALVSFAYNEGVRALQGSHLLSVVNAAQWDQVENAFNEWIYVHQGNQLVRSQGLVNRRANEYALFAAPVGAPPATAPVNY
jgi:lysozyme